MKFTGAIPALFTPYDGAGAISEEMLRRLVDVHHRAGASGLYVCGSSGEGLLLTTAERRQVAEIAVRASAGRLPVIVHVGSVSTREAVELAGHAQQIGAAAISSIPPVYFRISVEGIHRHYTQIAGSCALPLLLYNIPALAGTTVTPRMMAEFMRIPTVTGLKFSSDNLFQMQQMLELGEGRLNVLSGNDEIFLAALAMGAHGSIGLTHNFMPRLYVDLFERFRSGHWEEARQLQAFADRVIGVLLDFPVIPAAKEIMRMKGHDCGECRGPLEPLTDEQRQGLHDGLARLGFFEKDLGL